MSSESLGGQILVGVTVAAIVGIGGWVLGRATAPAEPPSARQRRFCMDAPRTGSKNHRAGFRVPGAQGNF